MQWSSLSSFSTSSAVDHVFHEAAQEAGSTRRKKRQASSPLPDSDGLPQLSTSPPAITAAFLLGDPKECKNPPGPRRSCAASTLKQACDGRTSGDFLVREACCLGGEVVPRGTLTSEGVLSNSGPGKGLRHDIPRIKKKSVEHIAP